MTTISIVDIRKRLADVLNRAGYRKERVVLTRHGNPIAAIVPLEDYEQLELLERHRDVQNLLSSINDSSNEFEEWAKGKKIKELMNRPVKVESFKPLSRREIYD